MSSEKPIVIFGLNDFASLACFYLRCDTGRRPTAFSVHRAHIDRDTYEGLPVVPFEDLLNSYPPSEYELFAPMSPRRVNADRQSVFEEGKNRGYVFFTYVSSKATTFDDLSIGENGFVLEDNTIQPFVTVGNNVVMWSGNHIGHHSQIADHVFIASHVVVSGHCRIGRNSYLGVNATLRNGLSIADGTMIGMGANVVSDTSPFNVYVGNPAKATGADAREVEQ